MSDTIPAWMQEIWDTPSPSEATEITIPTELVQEAFYHLEASWEALTSEEPSDDSIKKGQDILNLLGKINKIAGFDVSSS